MDDDEPGAGGFLAGLSAGTRIAGYRLEEQIGHGGMAVVFRAADERLERQVALKILSPALATDDAFRHRFIRESRSAAAVDDPHIIPVFEAGEADGVLFIAMRYVPGGDVGTLVHRQGPLPVARAAGIISAVASALDAAHAAGLVHRDVKPANMLVDARPGRPDHVYLSDFGLTKGALSSVSQTGGGHFMGTLAYCAPEQISGQPVDARADEYALAGAALVLLSGAPPFPRDDVMAVMYAHLSADPPRLTSRRPDLPSAADDVLLRALAKAPEDRYASCGEFADALRVALGLQRYDCDVAVALHERSLTDQQHRQRRDHADSLVTNASLAAADDEPDGSAEALARHAEALVTLERTVGPEHPDTLATRFAIAQVMAAQGDHAAAEREFRTVLAVRQRTLGRDHPDTLATWFAIAQELAARGDHDEAERRFRHVLATRQRTLGPEHPDTLAAWFSIGRELAARGDHAGAADQLWDVLEARQRTLGAEHPDTLATRFTVAQEMAARGDHAEAEDQFQQMLEVQARILGTDHPDTLIVRFSLANQMAARGDHAGAEQEFRDLLPCLDRGLGPDHPDTLAARFAIAQEIAARDDHATAEDEFRQVLAARQQSLGRHHPDTLIAWFSVAQEMAARGDHAGAEDEFRDVLSHLERRLGPDHPVTLVLWFSITREMAARGETDAAAAQFRDMLPHLRRRLGPDHPDTLAAASWLDARQAGRPSPPRPRTGDQPGPASVTGSWQHGRHE